MSVQDIVIASAVRTALGGFQGAFSSQSATDLGAVAVKAAVVRAGIDPSKISDVLMGCVLPAGLGQAPARQAAIKAGIPESVPCTTVSKVCGSGMKALMIGADQLRAGAADWVVAGGMESMTNAPYLLPKARGGYRLGHGEVKDHMFLDGLEDAYEGKLMGTYAEDTARHFQLTREIQDDFALESLRRAKRAGETGAFADEIIGVAVKTGEVLHDEQPAKADPAKIPKLKPAFSSDGTVTAANSSSISDGAAALVLTTRTNADIVGQPLARIVAQSSHARAPRWFTTAPVGAINAVLDKAGWTKSQVDLYEINEAFAVVALVTMQELGLPHDVVNVNGGACALGHPIGASGARIVVTLINALKARGLKRGIASLCIGGGEATALAIEVL
jgi:acetyl-CoA C-acetyltransferase